MKKFCVLIFVSLVLFSLLFIQAQTRRVKQIVKNDNKISENKKELDKDPLEFRSPFRYVIVYNEISETSYPTRSVEVLMDEGAFNEGNLKQLFQLLDKRFPSPERLTVTVNTSIKTIETPEERDIGNYSLEAGRLTDEIKKHKDAFYIRYQNGYRRFRYTVNLLLKRDKDVELASQ